MNKRKNILVVALLTFAIGTYLLIYGIATLGFLQKNKIVVTTLATTGPDYEVVFGQRKLKTQLPDTSVNFDVGGIMTSGNGANDLGNYLSQNYLAFGDYFILTAEVVGMKKGDTDDFHPLVEILSWRHVDRVKLWVLAILDLTIFVLAILIYKKFKRQKSSANIEFGEMPASE